MSDTAAEAAPLVEFDRVSKKYGEFRLALADVSLRAGRSELLVLRGAGGAGKSTLLALAAGRTAPSGGQVRVAGQDLARLKPAELALLRRSMGIVTQELHLLDGDSARDNAALPARLAGARRDEAVQRADAALERVGIDAETGARRVEELSASERQRVALARAIVNRPALLLLDQPARGLGQGDIERMVKLLEQFAIAGTCVIVTAHEELPLPARARELRIDNGRIAG